MKYEYHPVARQKGRRPGNKEKLVVVAKEIPTSKYMPHQGEREKARRLGR